ncbi:MAG TPA: non-ribosomal peptide synthetase, partial [Lachnospiraceae bacterium]|nr:non-ribosomal peptide synthetase [Lachnospiraceae bacterium]
YNAAFESIFGCRNVSDVTILSEKQEKQLDRFNETEAPYDYSKTVVELFMEVAAKYPDQTAVVYQDVKYTYSEFEKITRKLAGALIHNGLKTGDVAAVLIPRCEYMAICSIGIARSGCACQPLDHTYPQDRLHFMLEDSGAKLLITTQKMRELVPDYTGKILYLDEIPDLPEYTEKLPSPKPEDLFTLLYTSGSTGVPKGCMLEFGNITAFCIWYHKQYQLDSSSRMAAYASYGFDASMMDIFTSLTAGAQLNIIAEEIRLDLLALNNYFEENEITHSFMTTQVGRQFAMEIESKTLKYLSTGGEKLVPLNPPEGIRFYNAYGPTECTVYTTLFEVDRYYDDIPIGKPLDNLKLYIVDDKGHRLPAGASGELLVSGRQVSRGYLNRPEKTKEVYAKNPYTDKEGYERMYHTGDVVRCLNDGNISFVGRRDAQVKIRGFRIELTEVEEVIRRFPGIKDATVAAFDEESGGKYIAAYVVSDDQIDINKLNAFIMETKPPYMVPAVTMQIDRIPLNQNQKVNKRALPKPQKAVEEMIPPKNEMQERICDCIAEAIGHREFGITTDIQFAGLTS